MSKYWAICVVVLPSVLSVWQWCPSWSVAWWMVFCSLSPWVMVVSIVVMVSSSAWSFWRAFLRAVRWGVVEVFFCVISIIISFFGWLGILELNPSLNPTQLLLLVCGCFFVISVALFVFWWRFFFVHTIGTTSELAI